MARFAALLACFLCYPLIGTATNPDKSGTTGMPIKIILAAPRPCAVQYIPAEIDLTLTNEWSVEFDATPTLTKIIDSRRMGAPSRKVTPAR